MIANRVNIATNTNARKANMIEAPTIFRRFLKAMYFEIDLSLRCLIPSRISSAPLRANKHKTKHNKRKLNVFSGITAGIWKVSTFYKLNQIINAPNRIKTTPVIKLPVRLVRFATEVRITTLAPTKLVRTPKTIEIHYSLPNNSFAS
jgi:hypothetical protein